MLKPRVDGCVERLQKAQKDGQLRVDVEPQDVVELLYAPLYYRLLLHIGPVTEDQVDTILDLTFGGLKPQ